MGESCFYIENLSTQFCSVRVIEHQADEYLFQKQGKAPNNFKSTIKEPLKPSALKLFKENTYMILLLVMMPLLNNKQY